MQIVCRPQSGPWRGGARDRASVNAVLDFASHTVLRLSQSPVTVGPTRLVSQGGAVAIVQFPATNLAQMAVLETKAANEACIKVKIYLPFISSMETREQGVGTMERCPITICRNSATVLRPFPESRAKVAK